MKIWTGHPDRWATSPGPTAVTIGVLDGVHEGHRALIRHLDPSLLRTVLTFEPHPVEVLRPGTHPRLITSIDERLDLLEALGIDQVGVLDLTHIKELSAERFVYEVLVETLDIGQIVTGPDFRFGKDRGGDTGLLASMGTEIGFAVTEAPLVGDEEGVVSSSRIRVLIEEGRVAEAAQDLGSTFRVTGVVVPGDKRGRLLGYPTANLDPPARKVIPATGVYAGHATLGESRFAAAVNVGVRPTFGGSRLLIEAHFLDFEAEMYGEVISVELAHYLRPEARFDGVDDLVAQMALDVAETRALLDRI